jgi:inosine-uridine nucleoside N-ribohydrolase
VRVHLDTDFAGDTDDAAALALLLGWNSVEIVGVTTVADPDGVRAGYAQRFLRLAGRDDVRVVAGAGTSLTTGATMGTLPDHDAYWGGEPVQPVYSRDQEAPELIARNVAQGATLIGIGPFTNLARCDSLRDAKVVCMGGWVAPPAAGLPSWGPDMDWNVQCDTDAMIRVFENARDLTLVTLAATLAAHLRVAHLPRLRAAGRVGALLARQAEAHAAEHEMATLGRAHAGLPDDLCNFQYDPVACAVALGWPGAEIASMQLRPVLDGAVLRFVPGEHGRRARVVTAVDGDAFADAWLGAIDRI